MRNPTVTAVLAIVATLVALVVTLLVPTPASAQELSGKVEAGDTIFITDRNGVQTTGRLLHLAPEGLTLLVGGQERLIPQGGVGRIEKRDSLWNGMLIGGTVSAGLIGMVAGATCSSDCGDLILPVVAFYGAIGAGIGALVDSAAHNYSAVDGPSLGSPNARRTPAPVASLDDLWLRVRDGDAIEVSTSAGHKIKGRFVQASRTSVTITVGGDLQEIRSSDVRAVRRKGNRYRSGALWGGAVFGALGALGCSGGSTECSNPALAGAWVGSSGALWGMIGGALIPKHTLVYGPDRSSSVRVAPMLQVGRLGVALSASF
jgi:hypothetical protein